MRKIILIAVGILAFPVAAGANAFDGTSKVGAADSAGAFYACGLSTTPPNSGTCYYYDNNSWQPDNPRVSPPGGYSIHTHSDIAMASESRSTTYGYYVAQPVGFLRDDFCSFYIDGLTVSNQGCQQSTVINPPVGLGPRVAATSLGATLSNWAFVMERTAENGGGRLFGYESTNEGVGVPMQIDLSALTGHHYDATGGPIAAAKSSMTNLPIVAVRTGGNRQIALVYEDAAGWHDVIRSLPLPVQVGNSIAIAATPSFVSGTVAHYEWIIVSGNSGSLYEAQLLKDNSAGIVSLSAWSALSGPSGGSVDFTTDAVTATWFNAHVDYQRIYARIVSGTSASLQTLRVTATGAVSGGWVNLTQAGTGNWGAQDSYLGYSTAVGNSPMEQIPGLCDATEMCILNVDPPVTPDFSWPPFLLP